MNRVYKIVWSKAKNAYVVTSELAKNHTRSASGKAVKAALTVAVGMGVLMGGYAADAAAKDIVDKGGNLIAYDISPANEGTNIAVGKKCESLHRRRYTGIYALFWGNDRTYADRYAHS